MILIIGVLIAAVVIRAVVANGQSKTVKKIRQRKHVLGWLIGAVICFLIGAHSLFDGFTHKGSGSLDVGGEDVDVEVLSQARYREECRHIGFGFLIPSIYLFWEFRKRWKARMELEGAWNRMINHPQNMQELYKNPQYYREDFKEWLDEHHPELKVWNPPSNSSN